LSSETESTDDEETRAPVEVDIPQILLERMVQTGRMREELLRINWGACCKDCAEYSSTATFPASDEMHYTPMFGFDRLGHMIWDRIAPSLAGDLGENRRYLQGYRGRN